MPFADDDDDHPELPPIPWERLRRFDSALQLDAENLIELSQLQAKNGDLDSIDRLEDDCVDAIKLSSNGGPKGAASPKQERRDQDKDDDKTVTCLYYALQCCECSIS